MAASQYLPVAMAQTYRHGTVTGGRRAGRTGWLPNGLHAVGSLWLGGPAGGGNLPVAVSFRMLSALAAVSMVPSDQG